MRSIALLLLLAAAVVAPVAAHVVSMSTGQAQVDGATVHYRLSIPAYETEHMNDPARDLLERIRFSSGGAAGRLVSRNCRTWDGKFLCDATYEFPQPVGEMLDVDCAFSTLGIPTHVHLLRATRGEYSAQAAFDAFFTHADLRFRPLTASEMAARDTAAGFGAGIAQLSGILLLGTAALVFRGWRHTGLLLGTLLAAEIGATLLLRAAGWEPALRFGEAAAALGAAYAASEVLLAPSHGLPLHAAAIGGALLAPRLVYRMASANAAPGWFLAGNSAAQLLLFTALALLSWRWVEKLGWPRTRRVLAGAVIACALVWFALQM